MVHSRSSRFRSKKAFGFLLSAFTFPPFTFHLYPFAFTFSPDNIGNTFGPRFTLILHEALAAPARSPPHRPVSVSIAIAAWWVAMGDAHRWHIAPFQGYAIVSCQLIVKPCNHRQYAQGKAIVFCHNLQ